MEIVLSTTDSDLAQQAIEILKKGVATRFKEALEKSKQHHEEHPAFELQNPEQMTEDEKTMALAVHRAALKKPFLNLGLDDATAARLVDTYVDPPPSK